MPSNKAYRAAGKLPIGFIPASHTLAIAPVETVRQEVAGHDDVIVVEVILRGCRRRIGRAPT